jgi:hypothetical protein
LNKYNILMGGSLSSSAASDSSSSGNGKGQLAVIAATSFVATTTML